VFAQGQAWQFKGWQWATPAEVFGNCAGFFMYFDDSKIPDAVKSWNVTKFPLKRQHRHLDGIHAYKMWEAIEDFVAKRKAPLFR
jgi:parafibromin